MKIVIVTGADGAGKDEVAHYLCQNATGGPWVMDHFGIEVEERCHGAHKLFTKKGGPCPSGTFEDTKDEPNKLFEGLPPRSAYRDFTKWVLSHFGASAPGRWILHRIEFFMESQKKRLPEAEQAKAICIADASTIESVEILFEKFGKENFTFVDVWRPGCVHSSAITGSDGRHPFDVRKLENNGTLEELGGKIREVLPEFFVEIPCLTPEPPKE